MNRQEQLEQRQTSQQAAQVGKVFRRAQPAIPNFAGSAPDWHRPMRPTHPDLDVNTPPVYEEGLRLTNEDPRPLDAPADWRQALMPEGVKRLPRDRRGFPIFKAVQHTGGNQDGDTVDFRVLNVETFLQLAQANRCAICGERLGRKLSFLGGPMCVQRRVFGDGPMHYACAQYARMVCPFLVNANRGYDTNIPEGMSLDPNVIRTKPARLVLYTTTDFILINGGEGKPICIVKPADSAEWYRNTGEYICRTKPTRYAQ